MRRVLGTKGGPEGPPGGTGWGPPWEACMANQCRLSWRLVVGAKLRGCELAPHCTPGDRAANFCARPFCAHPPPPAVWLLPGEFKGLSVCG